VELARPAGLEPTTPWFVGDSGQFVVAENQRLAALAVLPNSLIPPRTWHSQFELVTTGSSGRLVNVRYRPKAVIRELWVGRLTA
jgi:hypothetical protein